MEGYWIDNSRFFFLHENIAQPDARTITVPSIFNRKTDSIEEVLPTGGLAALLSDRSPQPLGLDALSSAVFDMPDAETLAVTVNGFDYLIDVRQGRVVEARESFAVPALYSPNGRYACFVKGDDLWLKECDTGVVRPLTTDGCPRHRYGQQPESAPSEGPGGQGSGPVGLWSPDSNWFLTHRIDEPSLPESVLIRHSPPGGGRPVIGRFIYPIPGDSLPIATYTAIHVGSGRSVTFDQWPVPAMVVSPISLHSAWFSGKDTAWFVRVDRYFKEAELVRLDLTRGSGHVVVRESTDSGYLDLHSNVLVTPNVRTLAGSEEIVWFSERDGWGHLYLYDAVTGLLKNRITQGDWLVRDIVHIDKKHHKILFLAGAVNPDVDPARRSLCSVNMDGSDFEVVLSHEGDVFVPITDPCGLDQDRRFRPSYAHAGVSPDGCFAVVRYGSVDRGNRTEIVDLKSGRGAVVACALPASDAVPPNHFMALATDGVTRLYGVMFFPSDFDESRQYPLIDYIYAGPHTQHQPQSFRSVNSAPSMSLAELGAVTIMLDTRGIPSRSKAFHQIGYGELLEPHLADHAAVVRQLCERHSFLDAERVGIIGYSAGGAAAARALFDYGDVFKAGISICGSHDSSLLSVFMSDKYGARGVVKRGHIRLTARRPISSRANCS